MSSTHKNLNTTREWGRVKWRHLGVVLYFEAIAPCFPHSTCCSLRPKPPSPWPDMRNFSQFLHQVTTPFSLGHLMAAGNRVSNVYHLSPSNGCVHFSSHRCQVYTDLFSLDWREHKVDRIVPISPRVPQQHILGGRGPAIGTAAKFKGGQGLQCHFVRECGAARQ